MAVIDATSSAGNLFGASIVWSKEGNFVRPMFLLLWSFRTDCMSVGVELNQAKDVALTMRMMLYLTDMLRMVSTIQPPDIP
jgi:hypothetical protein